jgi:uncharacterized membrane protein YcgQ (UPF0703/DUF1980 family)
MPTLSTYLGVHIMSLLQAFVICFIAYLIYKLLSSGGVPKSVIDKMTVTLAKGFKKVSQEHKETLAGCYDDFHSGDTARIDAAIKKLDDKFNEEMAEADEIIAKHNEKPTTATPNITKQQS